MRNKLFLFFITLGITLLVYKLLSPTSYRASFKDNSSDSWMFNSDPLPVNVCTDSLALTIAIDEHAVRSGGIYSQQKQQTQVTTDDAIERLEAWVIITQSTPSQIVHDFARWSQIAKTIEIVGSFAFLGEGHPMRARTLHGIQIHNTSLVLTRPSWQCVAHEDTAEVGDSNALGGAL